MGRIFAEGMQFFAYHGCFEEEQVIGTHFIVDVVLDTDTTLAETTDELAGTVNYQDVYHLVKTEMAERSKLLEHVARRIADRIKTAYPTITFCRVKVSKLNPPLGGKVDRVSVELTT